jgi:putative ABC transport system permease protein
MARVRALPGVQQASLTSSVPLRGVDWSVAFAQRGESVSAKKRDIDPDYFAVMGIPLMAGRTFSAIDTEASEPVAIVSRSLAERLFPGESPLGRALEVDGRPQIVGMVGDVRNVSVDSEGEPAYYVPRAQESSEICLVVRTAAGTPDLAPAVRGIVASIDPMQPVMNATTIDKIVSDSIADRRFYAITTVAFAAVTLLLAAAGIYGVVSYSIVARIREIGVRMALGAAPRRLLRMLIAQGEQPVVLGLGIGLVIAFWASRLIEQFLFDVRTSDLLTYVSAACGVLALTVMACVLPAMRAARLSPTVALRHD